MLTVLIKYIQSNREVVIEAETIEYNPFKQSPPPPDPNVPRSVAMDAETEERCRYNREDAGLLIVKASKEVDRVGYTQHPDQDYRNVFVMNSTGATVAKYTL